MNVRYKLVNWKFNLGAWSQAIKTAVDELGHEFVAGVLEVSPNTVKGWMQTYKSAYGEFPHPAMHNFMKVCNELDLDPREFFILEDA